jgi:hypothetical protein
MQMSRLYQTSNKKLQAHRLRQQGKELAKAGFQMLADANWELADWLDPPQREEGLEQPKNYRRPRGQAPS